MYFVMKNIRLIVSCAALGMIPVAHGESLGALDFFGSGFLSVGAGAMLGGTSAAVAGRNCPCFVTDYAQASVYDAHSAVQWKPESKLGLQGTAALQDSHFSVTAQAVARGVQNGSVDLEWLYGTYQFTDNTSIQVGRKRLPMFYYSDIQNVGFALPWTHLPPQFYGWEAVNYNGVNLRHLARLGDWDATLNVLAGSENINDSGYWKIYNGPQSRTSVKWKNILGGDLTLVNDWFETRFAYIQSDTERQSYTVWNNASQSYVAATDTLMAGQGSRQNIYTFSVNMDPGDWLLRSELLYIHRPGATYNDTAQLAGIGHKFCDWQVMATVSRYQAVAANGGDPQGQEGHVSRALTGRYNLTQKSAIKAQFDSQKDHGGANWAPRNGDATLLTFSYDMVF
jgi:hypothetical protein